MKKKAAGNVILLHFFTDCGLQKVMITEVIQMKWFLLLWGVLAGFSGIAMFTISRTAGIAFLIATVAIGCAGIIEAIEAAEKQASLRETKKIGSKIAA